MEKDKGIFPILKYLMSYKIISRYKQLINCFSEKGWKPLLNEGDNDMIQ